MIHLQQIATPVHDIVAGLCFAVARNFKSNLAKGRNLEKPIIFQGGVAANVGVIRAFTEILELNEGELIIPKHFKSMGALGSIYYAMSQENFTDRPLKDLTDLNAYLHRETTQRKSLAPLKKNKR
jgi:activator of 2-hydroxyglutaryl-CoA dehydratase